MPQNVLVCGQKMVFGFPSCFCFLVLDKVLAFPLLLGKGGCV